MPQQRGIPFGGEWSQKKLQMVKKYLEAYMQIMKSRPLKTGYIDAFAGSGNLLRASDEGAQDRLFPRIQDQEREFLQGSVRTALEASPPFDQYVFIEKDEEAYEELVSIEDEYSDREIELVNQDANRWLVERCKMNWSKHRAVVFLDPFGMQVSWSTVERIAQTEAIDLWVLFPLGIGANRMLAGNAEKISEGWAETLTDVFGTEKWKDEFYEPRATLFGSKEEKVVGMEGIAEFYISQLRGTFAKVADNPRPLFNSRGNPMYMLCFAASNPDAAEIAVRIAKHILDPQNT
jgi:three-Cys-motif partner protein